MNYFEQFCIERNIKQETINHYKTSIKKYTEYYNMSLDELIDEAIEEENENIDKRKRSIKTRLLQFRTHLSTETTLKNSSIHSHMKQLFALYSHFDIELPNLPPMHNSDIVETTYFDLPTKKHINMVLEISGIRIKSLVLFMASSGTGRTECANLTVGDFIEACSEYYTSENLEDILTELYSCEEPIVPTFYILRQKTSKKYYTFCTPECTNAIIDWLLFQYDAFREQGKELTMDDRLWGLSKRQITYHLSTLNDELNFGFKGSYRFLRPHTLRKFHASNIGLSQENIDLLQGRSRDSVHETYIKINPIDLKKKYMSVMENVTIQNNFERPINKEEFTININLNFYDGGYTVKL